MALEGDRVVDPPFEKSLDSRDIASQCILEAQTLKKKKKRSLKNKDSSIGIHGDTSTLKDGSAGSNSCRDSCATINAQMDFKTAALPVLSSNDNSLEFHNIDSPCDPEAKCPQTKKKKRKKRRKDKDASVDVHAGASKLQDDSVGTKSCHDSLVDIHAHKDFKTATLLVSNRNNNSESQNIDSQCNPEAECPRPKKKKSKRRLKDEDASIGIHADTPTPKDDSIGINSCRVYLVDNNAQKDFKIAALPVLSNNAISIESHNIDSLCNPEAKCPLPKKKKIKRRLKDKDALIDIHVDPSTLKDVLIETNSHHNSSDDINAMNDFKTVEPPVLSRNNNSVESNNLDSQIGPEAECPQPKKKKSKRRVKDKNDLIHTETSALKDDSVGLDSCHDYLVDVNAPPVLSRNNNSVESHNIDSQCNPEAECPQPKKKKRKRKLKDKDASIDLNVDTSILKHDSAVTNSYHDSLPTDFKTAALPVLSKNMNSLESHNVDFQCNPEAEGPKLKKKRKSKLKDQNASIDVADISKPKNDLVGSSSCHYSSAQINAQIEFKDAVPVVLSKNNDALESHNIDSLCNQEAEGPKPKKKNRKSRLKDQDALIDSHVDTSKLKDDSVGINASHDSLVENDALTDLKTAALPPLSGNKRKIMRKKQRSYSSGITDAVCTSLADLDMTGTEEKAQISENQGDSLGITGASMFIKHNGDAAPRSNSSGIIDAGCTSLADLDMTGTEEKALISENQGDSLGIPGASMFTKHNGDAAPSVVEKENIEKRRKKRKLDTFVIYDNVPHPHSDLDVEGIERDGLLSLKQNDSRSPIVNKAEKYDTNDESAYILDGNVKKRKCEKQKLNTSVITDKAHVHHAELDRSEEKIALTYVTEIDSQSTRSSNQGAAHISVEKENTTTNHTEGLLRSYSRKRRKSSDSIEFIQPATVVGEAALNSDKTHSMKFSNNEVEGVQASKVAASSNVVGNVLADKTSSDFSNVNVPCSESKDITEIKKSSGFGVSIENHNHHQLMHPLVEAHVEYPDKKLLILDVNGLLADVVSHADRNHNYKHDIVVSKKYVFKRPFCDNFLQFCFEKFNVGVWSSRLKTNLDKIIDFLMADSRHKLLFCWDQSHCTNTGFTTTDYSSKPLFLKELKNLWEKLEPGLPWNKGEYNESNTLLLDDSPYKALSNPANTAIFPHSYNHQNIGDSSLGPGGDLRVYLEKLAEAPNVQEYVAHNPFGQKPITELNAFYQKVLRSVLGDKSSGKIASSSEPYHTPNS